VIGGTYVVFGTASGTTISGGGVGFRQHNIKRHRRHDRLVLKGRLERNHRALF
jgi:hypothetical protein